MDGILSGQVQTKYGTPFLNSLDPNINTNPNFDLEVHSEGSLFSEDPSMQSEINLETLNLLEDIDDQTSKSILLLDETENLKVKSEKSFLSLLNINPCKKIKVVSIFGNTGEGKSYTMNQVFFNGEEVFKTSPTQTSCTLGVWAQYNPNMNVLCLDTEGLLGISKKENQRTRLLLKVLAVSDIIIYRTQAERLQRDMYTFLGGASRAYKDHFCTALQKTGSKTTSIGPGVIIFHETRNTHTLHKSADVNQSAEDIIRATFNELEQSYDAFSFIKYVGIKTEFKTSFKELKTAIQIELDSTDVRSPREAKYIFLMLKSLNEKFKSPISDANPQLYLPAFFTCPEKCQSCSVGCSLSMGHKDDGEPHYTARECKFQHQYQNCVYLCKQCYKNGVKTIVKPSYQSMNESSWSSYLNYVWAGYIIECPKCGEIYRSRQHWYGNRNPEDCAVRIEVVHIWPGEKAFLSATNSAQRVLDGVTMISEKVVNVSSQPTKVVSDWMTDKIAPSYWRPNHEITECKKCSTPFAPNMKKHHCRSCGEGFCENCSSKRQEVPSKGWFSPVRVCDDCYMETPPSLSSLSDVSGIRARQIGETVVSSISVVKSVLDIPKDFIKESARPSYWTPDNECKQCAVCERVFGINLLLHHCRECGKGVCNDCSSTRKPVPLRGWDTPVRVCDACR